MTALPRPIGTPVVVKVVRVSGTIKMAELEVIRRAKDIILRAKVEQRESGDGVKEIGAGMGMVGHIMKTLENRGEEVLVRVEEAEEESESE